MKDALQKAKSEGFKVYLKHHRIEDGGVTTKVALLKDNRVRTASAKCHPNDQFSKSVARSISIGRALQTKGIESPDYGDLDKVIKTYVFGDID